MIGIDLKTDCLDKESYTSNEEAGDKVNPSNDIEQAKPDIQKEESKDASETDNEDVGKSHGRNRSATRSLFVAFLFILPFGILISIAIDFKKWKISKSPRPSVPAAININTNDDGVYCISEDLAQSIQNDVMLNGNEVVLQLENYPSSDSTTGTNQTLIETLVATGAEIDESSGGVCYKINDPALPDVDTLCIRPSDKCAASSSNAVTEGGNSDGETRKLLLGGGYEVQSIMVWRMLSVQPNGSNRNLMQDPFLNDHDTNGRILEELGGNPTGTAIEKAGLLNAEQCQHLKTFVEQAYHQELHEGNNVDEDIYNKHVTPADLEGMIGKDSVNHIREFAKESLGSDDYPLIDELYVRRSFVSDMSLYIPYHTEERPVVMIALNGLESGEYVGGELVYLNEDGPLEMKREVGKAIGHNPNTVHMVTPHAGIRYTLFLWSKSASSAHDGDSLAQE